MGLFCFCTIYLEVLPVNICSSDKVSTFKCQLKIPSLSVYFCCLVTCASTSDSFHTFWLFTNVCVYTYESGISTTNKHVLNTDFILTCVSTSSNVSILGALPLDPSTGLSHCRRLCQHMVWPHWLAARARATYLYLCARWL